MNLCNLTLNELQCYSLATIYSLFNYNKSTKAKQDGNKSGKFLLLEKEEYYFGMSERPTCKNIQKGRDY